MGVGRPILILARSHQRIADLDRFEGVGWLGASFCLGLLLQDLIGFVYGFVQVFGIKPNPSILAFGISAADFPPPRTFLMEGELVGFVLCRYVFQRTQVFLQGDFPFRSPCPFHAD